MIANENPLTGDDLSDDDLTLVQRYVSQGDRNAMLLLICKHRRMVFGTCRRYFGCEADAEDAMQDVFLTFMANAGSIKTNVGGWLCRCAINTAASMIRTRQNRLRRENEKARQSVTSSENEETEWSEWVARLPETLGQLDPADHGLLFQNCVVGNTQKEIASSLGISQQAVAKRIGKAITQVRRALLCGNGVAVLVGAILLLAKRIASAAVPHGLRTSLASPAASGTALGGGTIGAAKVSVAAVVVFSASIVVYECSESTTAATVPPTVPVVTAVSLRPAHGIPKPVPLSFPGQTRFSGSQFVTAYPSFQIRSLPLDSGHSAPSNGSTALLNFQFESQSNGSVNWQDPQRPLNVPSTMPGTQLAFQTPVAIGAPAGRRIFISSAKILGKTPLSIVDVSLTNDQATTASSDMVVADQISGTDASLIQPQPPDSVVANTVDVNSNPSQNVFSGSNGANPRQFPPTKPPRSYHLSDQASWEPIATVASTSSEPALPLAYRIRLQVPVSDLGDTTPAAGGFRSSITSAVSASEPGVMFRHTPSITSPTRTPLENGVTQTSDQTLISAGDTYSPNGEIDGRLINQGLVAAGDQTLFLNGLVSGRGSYRGTVVFTGGFSPGNSPAAVHVDNAILDSTNTLTMELAGLTPGDQYDQVIAVDNLALGGQLDVSLIDGFVPKPEDSFQLFVGSVDGRFTNITLPTLAGGLSWDTSRLYTRGSLAVAVPEPASLILLLPAGVFALLRRRQRNEHQLKSYCQRQADSIFIGCWWLRRVVPD